MTRIPILFSLLLLLCALAVGAIAAPVGLANFHQVGKGIYRGAAPTRAGMDSLRTLKVRTIIDLRIEQGVAKSGRLFKADEQRVAQALGMRYVNLRMGREAPTQQQVNTLLSALAGAESNAVYVHCQHGADRTGSMIGIYRVQVQGWSFSQAWQEMRRYGFKPHLTELKNAVRTRAK